MTAAPIAGLDGIRGPDAAGWWTARCPLADRHRSGDRHPSLRLRELADGGVFVRCMAGCPWRDVRAALGLDASAPRKDRTPPRLAFGVAAATEALRARGITQEVVEHFRIEADLPAQAWRYPIFDLRGRVASYRYKAFSPNGAKCWWPKDDRRRFPLYADWTRIEDVAFLVEGEPDFWTAWRMGLPAMTFLHGAGHIDQGAIDTLKALRVMGLRTVVIVPQNDEAGQEGASRWAAALQGIGLAVGLLRLPDEIGGAHVKDLNDALRVVGDPQALEALLAGYGIEEFVRPSIESTSGRMNLMSARSLCETQQEGDDVDWLWHGFLAQGAVTLLAARPKVGKSTLVYHAVKPLLEGSEFLGAVVQPCRVLILSEEPKALVRRRLRALGLAERDDLHFIFRLKDTPAWTDLLVLLRPMIERQGIGVLVIDTADKFWQGDFNAPHVSLAHMQPLLDLARELNLAVLLLHHRRKAEGEEGTAVSYSHAITGAADIVIEMVREPHHPSRRLLKSLSRYEETPQQLVIELTLDGYRALGDPQTLAGKELGAAVLDALPSADAKPVKTDEVIMEGTSPGRTKVYNVLEGLRSAGRVERLGAGKRGDAYRWRRAD